MSGFFWIAGTASMGLGIALFLWFFVYRGENITVHPDDDAPGVEQQRWTFTLTPLLLAPLLWSVPWVVSLVLSATT